MVVLGIVGELFLFKINPCLVRAYIFINSKLSNRVLFDLLWKFSLQLM